jgi:hypothetical protein
MILTTQRFFLIVLGLLQLIAPLVHAHSNLQFSQFGLHLPTLEVYSSDTLPAESILQAIDSFSAHDSAIVSISHGIKNVDAPDSESSDIGLFFITLFVFAYSVLCTRIHFSPPRDLQIKKTSLSAASPRAPPVSFYC